MRALGSSDASPPARPLDEAIRATQARSAEWTLSTWDDARAGRVLASAMRRRESRARRGRLLHRAAVVGSGAALLVFVFFRTATLAPASTGPERGVEATSQITPSPVAPEPIAARPLDDGGFLRD